MKNAPLLVAITKRVFPFGNVILGLVIYLIGFLISVYYNLLDNFLQVMYFPLATFGIIWVSSLWTWGFNSLAGIFKEIDATFEIDPSQFKEVVKNFSSNLSSDKRGFLFSIPGFAFLFYHSWLILKGEITIPNVLPFGFSQNFWMFVYVTALFAFVMYLIFASVSLLIHGLLFLRRITRYKTRIKLPPKNKVKLEKTNGVILRATFGWFVGVSLVMTLLFSYSSTIVFSFMAFVVAFGLLFFFIPQLFFHNSISNSKEKLLGELEKEFSTKTKLPLSSDSNIDQALLICTLFDKIERISEWTFESNTLIKLFSSVIIPVAFAVFDLMTKMGYI